MASRIATHVSQARAAVIPATKKATTPIAQDNLRYFEVMPFSENLNSRSTWFQAGGTASHDDFTLLTRRLYIDCGYA